MEKKYISRIQKYNGKPIFINESQNLIKLCTYIHFINLNIVERETKLIDEMSSVTDFKTIPTLNEKSSVTAFIEQ